MQINPEAQNIYNKYISRATVYSNSSEINSYSKKYLDIIFNSAAGADGVLSKEEAGAVEQFFNNSGYDLKQIGCDEAENLASKWSSQAAKYLPSITQYSDIADGFDSLYKEALKVGGAEKPVVPEEFLVKQSVFFNRIMKGKNALGENTTRLIGSEIKRFMSMSELNSFPGDYKHKAAEFCVTLLENTIAKNDEGKKDIYNAFVDNYFPNNPRWKRV